MLRPVGSVLLAAHRAYSPEHISSLICLSAYAGIVIVNRVNIKMIFIYCPIVLMIDIANLSLKKIVEIAFNPIRPTIKHLTPNIIWELLNN